MRTFTKFCIKKKRKSEINSEAIELTAKVVIAAPMKPKRSAPHSFAPSSSLRTGLLGHCRPPSSSPPPPTTINSFKASNFPSPGVIGAGKFASSPFTAAAGDEERLYPPKAPPDCDYLLSG